MRTVGMDEIAEGHGPVMVHASCVSVDGRAAVLFGPSGSGKSSLALQMMALGADLVADDRTILTGNGASVTASCPDTIRGQIEARGVGILQAHPSPPAQVHVFVDMAQIETARLPEERSLPALGVTFPLLRKVENLYFPAALVHYLKQSQYRQ